MYLCVKMGKKMHPNVMEGGGWEGTFYSLGFVCGLIFFI